jgi:hypothetical protein
VRVPKRLWIPGAVLVVVALVVGGLLWQRGRGDTSLEWAAARTPQGTERISWTDWSAVRAREHAHLSDRSSAHDVRRFLTAGFDDDLTSTSALVTSAPVLQQRFGFSPASLDWELFAQSYQGAVVMMHVPSSVDLDAVANHLTELGYHAPPDPTGVWNGGVDLVTQISANLTPELANWRATRTDPSGSSDIANAE